MDRLKKAAGCLFLLTLFFCQTAFADSPLIKLSRGITNTFTGALEYGTHAEKQIREHGPATGLVAMALYGTYYGVIRTVAGVYEVGTFLIPIPRNYESVIKPDTLF